MKVNKVNLRLMIFLNFLLFNTIFSNMRISEKTEFNNTIMDVPVTYLDTLNQDKEISLNIDSLPSNNTFLENRTITKEKKVVKGFRIQIVASRSKDMVENKKMDVKSKIDMEIYIKYESPYYKMYAGDFTDREIANEALKRVKKAGYSDAWIVKSQVFVNE